MSSGVVAALMECGCDVDTADLILRQKAALTIQSFYRRSIWCVLVESDDLNYHRGHYGLYLPFQGSNKKKRYKPLGIALQLMMHSILIEQKALNKRTGVYKKRKNLYFKVTLMRSTKCFGDIPIISVTDTTIF